MKLTNEAGLPAAWTVFFRPDGREALTIIAKATYVLCAPATNEDPPLAEEPVPLVESDVFGEDPAKNATLFETDFAPIKPECDVLLVGSAHAPNKRAVQTLPVRLRLGPITKTFVVTGRRSWQPGLMRDVKPGDPQPFVSQPISYDVAFGGTEADPNHPDRIETFLENPVGRGFRRFKLDLAGHPMPQTEEAEAPIRDPRGKYRPMAFGPLGRSWRQRAQYAGTYDQNWLEKKAPLMPPDFDTRYFQSAPPDQRMPYPKGGEPIELTNLVPPSLSANARVTSRVPHLKLGAMIVPANGEAVLAPANLDTIVFEPDANRFTCTYRATHPLERDAFEVREIILANTDPRFSGKLRARATGKEHFADLDELARSRKKGGEA